MKSKKFFDLFFEKIKKLASANFLHIEHVLPIKNRLHAINDSS